MAGRASNSRKHKIIEDMIKAELNPWAILFGLSWYIPLTRLERALRVGKAEKVGLVYITGINEKGEII